MSDPGGPGTAAVIPAPNLDCLDPQLRFVVRAMLSNVQTRPDHILILADAIEELARDGPGNRMPLVQTQWLVGRLRDHANARSEPPAKS